MSHCSICLRPTRKCSGHTTRRPSKDERVAAQMPGRVNDVNRVKELERATKAIYRALRGKK